MRQHVKAARLGGAFALLMAILACGGSDATSTQSQAGSGPADEEQARSQALQALEAHLGEGSTYGEGPGGAELAAIVREALAPADGVAVRIVPGAPRNVVVLVRYRSTEEVEDLRDIEIERRNEEIDRIVTQIDANYGALGDNLAVAIRGAIFYGAIGVRRANQPMQYHTGSAVRLSVIDPILTAPPGTDAPMPALVLGTQVEGTVEAPPAAPAAYRLELSEPTLVVTQLITIESGEAPFVTLCRGEQRPWICADDESLQPVEFFQNDSLDELAYELEGTGRQLSYAAYRLAPGIYTAVVPPNCEWDGQCANAGTRFTLLATSPGR